MRVDAVSSVSELSVKYLVWEKAPYFCPLTPEARLFLLPPALGVKAVRVAYKTQRHMIACMP